MFASLKTRAAAAALCAGLLVSACATAPPQHDDSVGAAPALFVARDADSTIYLYGTVHLRRSGEPWGGPHVEAALAEAEEVWTETDVSPTAEAQAQSIAMRLGMGAQPLSSTLTPEQQARLAAVTERLGLPAGALEPMRPWMAALTLTVIPIIRAGYDPQAGVDRAVVAWARANGRSLRWFETAEEQIGFFSNLSEEAQREMLLYAIDEAEGGAALIDELSAAWERGDLTALEARIVEEVRADYPEAYESLFVRRNEAWVEVLMQELDGSGVDFVAVGAGHLVGSDSVVAMLRARGVQVERVR